MTKPSREDVLKVASACLLGVTLTHNGEPDQFIEGANWTEELECFAAAMYAAGVEAMREQAVPEGWQLVPIEPTDKMLEALYRARGYHPRTVYRDLLATLPITTTEGEE